MTCGEVFFADLEFERREESFAGAEDLHVRRLADCLFHLPGLVIDRRCHAIDDRRPIHTVSRGLDSESAGSLDRLHQWWMEAVAR